MHRMRSTLAGARSLAVMAVAVTVVAIGATAIMVAAMAIAGRSRREHSGGGAE